MAHSSPPAPFPETALVLFSGGQDSTTCLAWALENFNSVETIGFDYGQRHRIELTCRKPILRAIEDCQPHWAGRLGPDVQIPCHSLAALGTTAMTSEIEIIMEKSGLPNTFVPGRNLLFLTLAGALAYRRGIRHLVAGMCEVDYSNYPDCRHNSLSAQTLALSLGMDRPLELHTPLMWINKAQTWQLAKDLGGQPLINLLLEESHTCYLGNHETRHPWGYGCGNCPACDLRKNGWHDYRGTS